MKKIFFASGLIALMAAATSCEHYDIYPESFDGVFTIRDAGTKELTVFATDEQVEVPFVVVKGGYDPEHVSSATIKTMSDTEFADYQQSSGNTHYTAIGRECYSFSPEAGSKVYAIDYDFSNPDERYRVATLYIRPRDLRVWLDNNAAQIGEKTPVIPVTLVSDVDSVNVYGNVSIVIPEVRIPELAMDVSGVIARTVLGESMLPGANNEYRPEANFSMPCSNPWGFTLNLKTDNSLIDRYNAEHGTAYLPLSSDAYELKTGYHFEPGVTSMPIDLKIDLNKVDPLRKLAVAVALADTPITWDDDANNPGDALEIDADNFVLFSVRIIDDNVELVKIPLTASNVTTNDPEPSEGSIAALFDDEPGTYFHSGWSQANPREATYCSYLEITLPSPSALFGFKIANRQSPTAAGYVKTVHLFGTNDPANWPTEPFAVITDMNVPGKLDSSGASAEFGLDGNAYKAEDDYKYIRFCVIESGGGSLAQTTGSVYWCASALELYGY